MKLTLAPCNASSICMNVKQPHSFESMRATAGHVFNTTFNGALDLR